MGIIHATRLTRPQVATSAAARALAGESFKEPSPQARVIFAHRNERSLPVMEAQSRQEWVPSCAKWIVLCLRENSSKWAVPAISGHMVVGYPNLF